MRLLLLQPPASPKPLDGISGPTEPLGAGKKACELLQFGFNIFQPFISPLLRTGGAEG